MPADPHIDWTALYHAMMASVTPEEAEKASRAADEMMTHMAQSAEGALILALASKGLTLGENGRLIAEAGISHGMVATMTYLAERGLIDLPAFEAYFAQRMREQ